MKIEINMEKKHFWALVGVIVLLFGVTAVIAKTTTPIYTDDQPFHDTLYADVIAGKSADNVAVDDNLNVKGNITASNITSNNITVVGNVVVGNVVVGNKVTLGGVSKNSWPIYDYCYYDCWVGPSTAGGGGDCSGSLGGSYICCNKQKIVDGTSVATGIPMGFTTRITMASVQGVLVKC